SVEQQRLLGGQAPSLYDMRNLFQVNVEEGRHLWAMAYLLHRYFGRDGRDEAEDLLVRRSGNEDSPRILGAFNQPIETFLDFLCFAMFADRDGKYQLAALAESAFSPLARSTQFMLTEEAHHLFVGETGIARVVARTVELMQQSPNEDVTDLGGIPLDLLQKHINSWVSVCLDLFGGDDSSNAAHYFAAGLKGRYKEASAEENSDHTALEGVYELEVPGENGTIGTKEVPMRRAMNRLLQDGYYNDCARAVRKWNSIIAKAGIQYELSMPSVRFNRMQGPFAGLPFAPNGEIVLGKTTAEVVAAHTPSRKDIAYEIEIMKPVREPGKFANWIAAPKNGINRQAIDFEYVRFT
ncbi:MAG: benzoyl-CoA 2,3-epoxidase subunit BoxB, partial [Planctomycetota bacterium]|nr:benzoyl-CoA 2,3-epoxidase subunit BoxB [Planctomycetota bacterium]